MPCGRKVNNGGLSEAQEEASLLPHTQSSKSCSQSCYIILTVLFWTLLTDSIEWNLLMGKITTFFHKFVIAFFMNMPVFDTCVSCFPAIFD